ncbi:Uma2 family endonuclease [Crocosphaera sp.]|uniref:Uma2 family endonuclease n=1 Tax=Crocosphaera sp. TaxID=2729996 RepID=UPI00260753D7|nr:Uma2 family endonuclease [Crocosphaera sp.]MDJ0580658.1 Uma2 family endonuclease [Crocosphaera sp.]
MTTYTLMKWTIEDYHRMIEAGIINNHHVELISGEIIEMSPEETFHRFLNHRGVKYLRSILGNEAEIMESHPITLLDSEPEPDITIVRSPDTLYLNRHPYPEDIYWLIEIADSTLNKDLIDKKALYAKFNITEYWVIDIKNKILYVFQNPQADDYKITKTYQEEIINPLAFPKVEIDVKKLMALE